jgi:hypothetical protein
MNKWKRIRNGYYVAQQGLGQGIIERSERGFWWWIVIGEGGNTIKADRTISLKDAQRQAWAVVSNYTLKSIKGGF